MANNMDNQATVGQKIKHFRKRAGISQLELEVRIGTSPGSISRIESGEVNPTKETLGKIVEALTLNPYDSLSLFDLHAKEVPHIVKNLVKLTSSLNYNEVLQNSVDLIASELNLIGVAMFMVNEKDGTLYSNVLSNTKLSTSIRGLVKKFLGKNFGDVHVSIKKHCDNLLVRTVTEKKVFYTNDLWNCTIHAYPRLLSNLVSNIVNFKSAITFPLIIDGSSIGAIFYVSDMTTDFNSEIPIFEAFNEHISTALANAKKYENLKTELLKLKSNKNE